MIKLFDSSLSIIQTSGVWIAIRVFRILKAYVKLPYKEGVGKLANELPSDTYQKVVAILTSHGIAPLWDSARLVPKITIAFS